METTRKVPCCFFSSEIRNILAARPQAQLVIRFNRATDRDHTADRPTARISKRYCHAPTHTHPFHPHPPPFDSAFYFNLKPASVRESTPANYTSAKMLWHTCALFSIIAARQRGVEMFSLEGSLGTLEEVIQMAATKSTSTLITGISSPLSQSSRVATQIDLCFRPSHPPIKQRICTPSGNRSLVSTAEFFSPR